jgi:RNA polymerase sigma-70 factor (ECF subfamily)
MVNNSTEAIWYQLHDDLRQFISSRVVDGDAEDILQDVFLKIHAQIGTVRDEQKLVSWAYQITRNAIADYYRSQQPYIALPETLAVDEDNDTDLSTEFAPCLQPMIDDLPDKYREALLLTEYEGLTLQNAADTLKLSLSGAKSRVQRGRELLKRSLLQCCHFEFDRRGRMIDYYPYCNCCEGNRPDQSCASDCSGQRLQIAD